MANDPVPRSRLVLGWLALLALNALFWIPSAALPGHPFASLEEHGSPRLFFSFLWLSEDIVLVAVILHLTRGRRVAPAARRGAAILLSLLFVYELYDVAMLVAFRRAAVLYDDILLAGGAAHLAHDLSSSAGLTILGAVVGLAGVGVAIPRLLAAATRGLEVSSRATRVGLASLVALVVLANVDRGAAARDGVAQSPAHRLSNNLQNSMEMARALDRVEAGPTVAPEPPPPLALSDAPNVYLFMVEAYGSILLDDPEIRPKYLELLSHLEARLDAAGWSSASARSDSPVVGGTSWLAMATVLGGLRIDSQHLYHRFISRHAHVALPGALRASGYSTASVEPGTRVRPGLPTGNPYGYEHTLLGDDLNYRGPAYGWGVIPDQYSLGFAEAHLFSGLPSPHFVFFMSVSTHVPWNQIPPLRRDWRTLDEATDRPLAARLRDRLAARVRGVPELALDEYFAAVTYDLVVLTDFIVDHVPKNSVVLLMGDHQPLLLDTHASDRSTPLHILSDDPSILGALEALEAQGALGAFPPASTFRPGLAASRNTVHLRHEAIQSLLFRLLTEARGDGGTTPEYRPSGAPLSFLGRGP